MRLIDANDLIGRLKALSDIDAKLVRILSEDIDPPKEGDSGWDVEVTVLSEGETNDL